MQRYDADQWTLSTKDEAFPVGIRQKVSVHIAGSEVVIEGKKNGKFVPIHSLSHGKWSGYLMGFTHLRLRPVTNGATYGYCISLPETQNGEPIDHEKVVAVPMPKPQDELLRSLHERMDQLRKADRQTVMEPEEDVPALYERTDDGDILFEEDEYRKAMEALEAENKKKAEEAEASKKAGQEHDPALVVDAPEVDTEQVTQTETTVSTE